MKYEKPEIKIKKFSILEDIMKDGASAIDFTPIDEDNNDDLVIESIGEAIGKVFHIN